MNRRLIKILLWIIGFVIFLVLTRSVIWFYGNNTCKEIRVNIQASKLATFINEAEVNDYILQTSGNLLGKPVRQINVELIENIINTNPYVLSSKVYLHLNGVLQIDVIQRKPIVRVQNNYKHSFYICEQGHMMPLSPGKTARVPVANGHIPSIYISSLVLQSDSTMPLDTTATIGIQVLQKVYQVANYINKDEFWRAQIQQIFIDEKLNIYVVPLVGNELILLGDEQMLPEKFGKLKVFIGKPEFLANWNNYDTINVGFQGQVICTKKIITLK